MDPLNELRLSCAAKIVALTDALRNIPPDLTPCSRTRLVAVREQIYFGWELPLARAEGKDLLFSKYERDGWWSEAAAKLVASGGVQRGDRSLERDHVEPVAQIVDDLLAIHRTPEETSELLQKRIVTCTVLAAEHRDLAKAQGNGWERYNNARIVFQRGL